MSEKFIIKSKRPPIKTPLISVAEYMWNELAKFNGQNISIIDANTDQKLTVEDLMTKSNAIANSLVESGVEKSDIIMTFAENSIDLVVALIGSTLLGVTLYPISPIANIYEMQSLLETLGSITIFATKTKTKIIEEVLKRNAKIRIKNIIVLDEVYDNYLTFGGLLKDGVNKKLDRIPYFDVNPKEDTFILLQSSGTSGTPKSVMISHFAFVKHLQTSAEAKQLDPQVFNHITPFGCISGSTILFSCIARSVQTVIHKEYNEKQILVAIDKYKVNTMLTTPTLVHKFIDEEFVGEIDLSSLKFVNSGGAAISSSAVKKLIEKYGLKFQEGYGMTECGVLTSFFDAQPEDPEYIPGNLGRPAPDVQIKVVDMATGHNLGPNIDGEICVKTDKMFSGYLNNPSATTEAFDSNGWYHTGDVGHYDKENRLFLTDRLKELIKFGTKQVSPIELEQFLLTHNSVAEVVVVGVKHKIETQWPRAYVKIKPGSSVTEEELKKYVADNLNVAKQLRAGVIFVDDIPRTTIRKVDRKYFKSLVAEEVLE